jgi:hypothetical protein
MGSSSLHEDLVRWGDRTSSYVSSYPHLRDELVAGGRVRVTDVPGAIVAASEPLCPPADRCEAFWALSARARADDKRAVMMPVSAALAEAVRASGGRSLCVGCEPVVELASWFGPTNEGDPYDRLPLARAVMRRGGLVEEWPAASLSAEQRGTIESLARTWREAREGPMVSFLNATRPLEGIEDKAVFVATDGKLKEPAAVVVAVPVRKNDGSGRVVAWFFADYFRHPQARAGTIEFLFIEAARRLYERGVVEVRLGLCPLAHLQRGESDGPWERLLRPLLSRHQQRATFPFRAASVAAFKTKLGPTRWDPLYVVTDGPRDLRVWRALRWAHFPEGPFSARTARLRASLSAHVQPEVHAMLRPAPRGFEDALCGGALVLCLAAICALLHVGRVHVPALQALWERSQFIPGAWSVEGVVLGPLFHNHAYHLCGDLLSLLFFGLLLEWSTGHALTAAVMAFGLWLTNPISTWIAGPLLQRFSPDDAQAFLLEQDVGSSNAVYAIVGACAVGLRRPWLLWLPFALNGVYLCVVKFSWLSVHHLVGLAGGAVAGWLWRLTRRHPPAIPPVVAS